MTMTLTTTTIIIIFLNKIISFNTLCVSCLTNNNNNIVIIKIIMLITALFFGTDTQHKLINCSTERPCHKLYLQYLKYNVFRIRLI